MFCSQCNHCTASMDLKEISDLQAFWFVRKQRPRQSRRAKSERRRGPRHSWPNLQRCVVMVIIFQNMVIGASENNKGVGLRGPPNKLLHKCQTERWQLYKQKADEFHEVSAVGSLIFGSRRRETVYNMFTTEKFAVAPIQKLPIQWDRNLTHFEGGTARLWQLWAFGNVQSVGFSGPSQHPPRSAELVQSLI